MWERIKKNKISLIVTGVTAVIMVVVVTSVEGADKMWEAIRNINPLWLLLAIGCFLLYWFVEAYITHLLIKNFAKKTQTLRQSVEVTIIGKMFDCITPSSTGGQPVQIYRLSQEGATVGRSTSALLMKLVIYQFISVPLAGSLMFLGFRHFLGAVSNFSFLAVIGLLANAAVGLGFFALIAFPKISHKIAKALINFLCRIKVLKNRKFKLARLDNAIKEFSEAPKLIKENRPLIAKLVGLTISQILLFYSIPYFVFLGLGSSANFLATLAAAACVYMISSYVPLPGGAVGAEGSFFLLFSALYQDGIVGAAVLIWRFITFYLPIVLGTLFVLSEGGKKVISDEDQATSK